MEALIIIIPIVFFFYFLPTLVAISRWSINIWLVFILNFLLWWTLIAWIACIFLAVWKTKKDLEKENIILEVLSKQTNINTLTREEINISDPKEINENNSVKEKIIDKPNNFDLNIIFKIIIGLVFLYLLFFLFSSIKSWLFTEKEISFENKKTIQFLKEKEKIKEEYQDWTNPEKYNWFSSSTRKLLELADKWQIEVLWDKIYNDEVVKYFTSMSEKDLQIMVDESLLWEQINYIEEFIKIIWINLELTKTPATKKGELLINWENEWPFKKWYSWADLYNQLSLFRLKTIKYANNSSQDLIKRAKESELKMLDFINKFKEIKLNGGESISVTILSNDWKNITITWDENWNIFINK